MVTTALRDAYDSHLESHGYVRDARQVEVLDALAALQGRLAAAAAQRHGLLSRLLKNRRAADRVDGMYIWGGVGRGKTFLMDLFFETLPVDGARRVHFHRMMQDVHRRLKPLGGVEDPLDAVAEGIARDVRVLCFDEFFVSDIGDAMILGRLLDGLFRRGVTLVATSNLPPDELYRDGLQRQRFLPAIERLKQNCRIVHLGGDIDFRLRLMQKSGTYFTPDDSNAARCLETLFAESASSKISSGDALEVNGRPIHVRRCAKGIAWFEFDELCDGPRGPDDYIEIARWYPTVLLSGIPVLDASSDNMARRFITLVDEFYDRNVKLVVSAEALPDGLYRGERLRFEFDRTVSRLNEMQSAEYLALPHLA